MNATRLTVIFLLVASIATLALAAGDPETSAIIDVLRKQDEAWNRGDLEGFMAGYWKSPDLVFTSGGRVRRGWQETYDKYKARYGSSPETMGKLEFAEPEVHLLGKDSAWVLGHWQLDGGNAGKSGGMYTLVMRKIDGRWVIVHDHSSVDSN